MTREPNASAPVKHTDALSQNTNPRIRIIESNGKSEVIGIVGTTTGGGPPTPPKKSFDPTSLGIEGLEVLDANDGTVIGIACTREGTGTTEKPPAMPPKSADSDKPSLTIGRPESQSPEDLRKLAEEMTRKLKGE